MMVEDCDDFGVGTQDHPYVLEEQVGYLLRRAHQRASAVFQDVMTDSGLSPLQFASLFKIGEIGEISQNLLGRMVGADPATTLGVVKRLMERGLVARRDDASDRRRALLALTLTGRALLDTTMPRGHDVTARTLEPLAPAERSQLLTLLKKLG